MIDIIACLNLVTASISPSIQDVRELHALSLLSAGRYTLDQNNAIKINNNWLTKFKGQSCHAVVWREASMSINIIMSVL